MITQEQLIKVENNNLPTKLEKWYYDNFSKEAIKAGKKGNWVIFGILIIPFFIGMVGSILDATKSLIEIATITLCILLLIFGIPWIISWYLHKFRIRKICKELNVTIQEYYELKDILC